MHTLICIPKGLENDPEFEKLKKKIQKHYKNEDEWATLCVEEEIYSLEIDFSRKPIFTCTMPEVLKKELNKQKKNTLYQMVVPFDVQVVYW